MCLIPFCIHILFSILHFFKKIKISAVYRVVRQNCMFENLKVTIVSDDRRGGGTQWNVHIRQVLSLLCTVFTFICHRRKRIRKEDQAVLLSLHPHPTPSSKANIGRAFTYRSERRKMEWRQPLLLCKQTGGGGG